MKKKQYRSNGPKAYARLIEQSVDQVPDGPLIYAYLVDAMHQTIEEWYRGRHTLYNKRIDDQNRGVISLVNPSAELRTIEACYDLLKVAQKAANGDGISAHKVNYRNELAEYRKKINPEMQDA
jgi:hypothetical protein